MHSFLHIAIVKSAFLSDKEENIEEKSISTNITLTSSRAIGVNLSVMRRLYDDSSEKSGIIRKQNGENVRDFAMNLKAKQEDRLTLGEVGPLTLIKILKGYPQGYLSSLLHTTQKVHQVSALQEVNSIAMVTTIIKKVMMQTVTANRPQYFP